MLLDDFNAYSSRCFRDCPPPCTSVCPLGLDVRSLVDKVRRKNFNAAYRIYRNQVLFPAIVSRICNQPCRDSCVRKNVDEAVFLRSIELACVGNAKNTDPIQYNVPAKPFTIAIIGAGMSGLSCALKMAARNYKVKVYEKNEKPGGRLWGLLEPDIFLDEIEKQFANVDYELFCSSKIDSLKDIKADAIYIATGQNGNDFGLSGGLNHDSLGTIREGVFLGGGLLDKNTVESIEHGVRVSYSIEKYLKVGAMDGMPETYARPELKGAFYDIPFEAATAPFSSEADISAQEAQDESLRCRLCNCSLCHDSCELMQHAKTFPPKMVTDVISTLGPKENLTQRVGMRMLNACTQCGLCKEVCPEKIDMESCLLEARRSLHNDGVMPPAYRDFWLRDMHFANNEAYFLHKPQGLEKIEYMFFPGCQLGASDPDYVLKAYEFIRGIQPSCSLMQACCSVPADWAGDVLLRDEALQQIKNEWSMQGQPAIILACPTCIKTFEKYLPECKIIPLYDMLADKIKAGVNSSHAVVSVYDPCSSRGSGTLQKSVRQLLQGQGMTIEELDNRAQCCGFGGHIQMADSKLFNAVVEKRIALNNNEYITYCTNCRDVFAVSGKRCRHVLDLLFTGNGAERKPPSLTQRRRNRMAVKRFFSDDHMQYESLQKAEDSMNLFIPDEISEKMNRLFILEEEVKAVIEHCEASGEKSYKPDAGQFIGYKQIGVMTYWVVYSNTENGLTLNNVYSHRMSIENT